MAAFGTERQTVASRLASFVAGSGRGSIPEPVLACARVHLLDTLGCGLAALGTGTAGAAGDVARAQGGKPEASVLGEAIRLPAALAAMANGARCHGLDFDDTHEAGICHSSTVVAPAALAVGEAVGRSGSEVLLAYAVGSEVALRVATRVADGLYERGFHPTPVCGAFGAAAAAARLLRLDETRTTNALGIAGSFASGLFEYLSDGSGTKPLHAGWAAQAGVQAARLAAASATGPASVLEGRFGLMASHTGDVAEADSISARLGQDWEVTRVSIKPFPACHFVHSSTWAVAELAEENGFVPDDIAEIVVRVPAEAVPIVLEPLGDKHTPRTPHGAKFSLPYAVAHRLVHGSLDLSAFSPAAIRDRTVIELAGRVRGEALSPAPSRFAGGAHVTTVAGGQFDRLVEHAPGSPRNPLSEDAVMAKFRGNAELALEPASAAALADELLALDEAPSVDRVAALLRRSSSGAPPPRGR